jgi:hypothetical protein
VHPVDSKGAKVSRSWVWLALLAVAASLAASGCGSSEQASSPEPPPPFSVTDSEVRTECLTGTYVLDLKAGARALKAAPPRDWHTIENLPKAVPSDRGAVRVDFRAKGGQSKLTLTEVKFHAKRYYRLPGEVFYRPCHRSLRGPSLEADLIATPVSLLRSNAAVDGQVGKLFHISDGPAIRFPWTVSLAKPFHLYLVVDGQHCYCVWSATIGWSMGSRKGVIQVDNGGKRYEIVDSIGSEWMVPGQNGNWTAIKRPLG